MSQGDKRLVWNLRERVTSADLVRVQGLAAAEKAGLLRSFYNDALGDWWSAGGLQTPIGSSSPSLVGDVYGGLMVQPDNAGYFLVTPGSLGVLEPSGLGADDNPYRVIVDPGVTSTLTLPFTSNAGGGSPRWDVIECQPADRMLEQQTRDIFNPATGIASPVLVDKVRAGQLNYRVRVGTPGSGFPGLAAGWLPLAVCCVPAGSSSLLQSDVWDVRPLVRERARPSPSDGTTGYAPIHACEYRLRDAASATFNQWVGTAEASWNGYQAGGKLDRSTPSTLAQFGSTGATGGRAGVFNLDLADNRSTAFTLAPNARVNLVALFPAGLPRWQRYSQVVIGSGRIPNGPRGVLVATTNGPGANGSISAVPLPTAMAFGVGATANGCLIASTFCDGGSAPIACLGSDAEHWLSTAGPTVAGTVDGTTGFHWDISPGVPWPLSARRVLCAFFLTINNAGSAIARIFATVGTSAGEVSAEVGFFRTPVLVSGSAVLQFQFWFPVLPRVLPTDPALPATMRLALSVVGDAGAFAAMTSASMSCLAWSSSDR